MGQPQDPQQQHQAGQMPPPPPPPQPQVVYVQAPAGTTRTKVGASAHTIHLILTVCTCGLWGFVWFVHWLFTRSKTVHR